MDLGLFGDARPARGFFLFLVGALTFFAAFAGFADFAFAADFAFDYGAFGLLALRGGGSGGDDDSSP